VPVRRPSDRPKPLLRLRDVVVTINSRRYKEKLEYQKRYNAEHPGGKLGDVMDSPAFECLKDVALEYGEDMFFQYLLQMFNVDVEGLLEGDGEMAQAARLWLNTLGNGKGELLALDGEGMDGDYYEVGVAMQQANSGIIKKLMDLTQRPVWK